MGFRGLILIESFDFLNKRFMINLKKFQLQDIIMNFITLVQSLQFKMDKRIEGLNRLMVLSLVVMDQVKHIVFQTITEVFLIQII